MAYIPENEAIRNYSKDFTKTKAKTNENITSSVVNIEFPSSYDIEDSREIPESLKWWCPDAEIRPNQQ